MFFFISHLFSSLSSISKDKLKDLCYQGIPSSIRVKVWPFLIGNNLQITPNLYEIFKSRALSHQILLNSNNEETEEKELNSHDLGRKEERDLNSNDLGKEDSMLIIQYDLPRTFPNEIEFHNNSLLAISLETVLKTYACYRPDIGYIQGMSYLAAMCLTYLDEYQSFLTFANLLSSSFNFNLYLLQPSYFSSFIKTFDFFFQRSLPDLYQHLLSECISSDIFLLDWALTLFTKAFTVQIASRLWDVYLFEGELFFIKTCLGFDFDILYIYLIYKHSSSDYSSSSSYCCCSYCYCYFRNLRDV